jgi:hypothetical protein
MAGHYMGNLDGRKMGCIGWFEVNGTCNARYPGCAAIGASPFAQSAGKVARCFRVLRCIRDCNLGLMIACVVFAGRSSDHQKGVVFDGIDFIDAEIIELDK